MIKSRIIIIGKVIRFLLNALLHFSGLIFILPVYPVLCCIALLARHKGNGIFIGMSEVAETIKDTTTFLRQKGYHCRNIAVMHPRFNPNDYDIAINYRRYSNPIIKYPYRFYNFLRLYYYFFVMLFSCSHYFFIWKNSFFPLYLDLPLLKLAQKKIIIMHNGGDVRYRHIHNIIYQQENYPTLPIDTPPAFDNLIFIRQLFHSKISDWLNIPLMTSREQETFLDRPAYRATIAYTAGTCLVEDKPYNKIPYIIHAPSNRAGKGTKHVLEAIAILKNDFDFEFELIENKPNDYVQRALRRADILIDQPARIVARLHLEGKANSCIVVGSYPHPYNGFTDDPSFFVHFERDTQQLVGELRKLLEMPSLKPLQQKHHEFFKYHYLGSQFDRYIMDIYDGNIAPNLYPLDNYKQRLLDAALNPFQRIILKHILRNNCAKTYNF
jgi:hypothetical protein